MYEVTITHEFSAAHNLRDYPTRGVDEPLHGHNWKVAVSVATPRVDDRGLAIDFLDVKSALTTLLKQFDYTYINAQSPFQSVNPSAENFAKFLFDQLENDKRLQGKAHITRVSVWETPDACASYVKDGQG